MNLRFIETLPEDVELRFNTKLTHVDFRTRTAYRVKAGRTTAIPGEEKDDGQVGGGVRGESSRNGARARGQDGEEGVGFDLIIGCDGSWSKVRSEMMRVER
jgi:kynurenine 3-monooxygenase